jgi:hypothetical protein
LVRNVVSTSENLQTKFAASKTQRRGVAHESMDHCTLGAEAETFAAAISSQSLPNVESAVLAGQWCLCNACVQGKPHPMSGTSVSQLASVFRSMGPGKEHFPV